MTTVLLADDNRLLRGVLYRFLGSRGYETRMAEDAEEAWTALQIRPTDLVISDVKLPGMNGCLFIRKVVAKFPGTRCMLVSGYTGAEMTVKEFDPSMPLMTKPFTVDDFLNKLDQLLKDPPWSPHDV